MEVSVACRPAGRCLRLAEALRIPAPIPRALQRRRGHGVDQPAAADDWLQLLAESLIRQLPHSLISILDPCRVIHPLWTLLELLPTPYLPVLGCQLLLARPHDAPLGCCPSSQPPRQPDSSPASSLGAASAATLYSPRALAFHSQCLGPRQLGQLSAAQRTQAEPASVPTVEGLQVTPHAVAAPIALPSLPRTASVSFTA